MIIVNGWLKQSEKRLASAGVATARLDCLVLLEAAVGCDRSWLLAHPEHQLSDLTVSNLEKQIERRASHEPLAYIRGKTEFYGREFLVTPDTLEPRPETETMIDLLKTLHLPETPHIIDVGTGSGAIGITAALEIDGSTVDLTDVNPECLKVSRQNLEKHKVTAELLEGDLLKVTPRFKPSVILANLPYVPDKYELNSAAKHEPKLAIFGGDDGLDLYCKLFEQIKLLGSDQKANRSQFDSGKPQFVLAESLPFQHQELAGIAKKAGYDLQKTDDFIQVFELV